jgi:hypothetical protein
MLDQERKRHEREIYNRQANMERPQFASYWDADLYRKMHEFAYDRQVEDLGVRFMTHRKVLALGAGNAEAKFALRFSSDVHALNISERAVSELVMTWCCASRSCITCIRSKTSWRRSGAC